MEGPTHDEQVAALPPPEEDPNLSNDVDAADPKVQAIETENVDSRVLQASLNSNSFNNAVQIPVMIPISAGSNRTEVIQSQLPGMVTQPIRNSFYTPSLVNSFTYQSGSTMTFNADMPTSSGPISISTSAPIQSLTHGSSIPLQGFGAQDMHIHSLEQENPRLVPGYFIGTYLKPTEEIALTNTLMSIDSDNGQVHHNTVIKLLQEIFSDGERSTVAKDDGLLHQSLNLFFQQHQNLLVLSVVFSQDPTEGKKIIDSNTFSQLFYQFYHTQESSLTDKDLTKKTPISGEITWPPTYPSETYTPKTTRASRPGKPTVLSLEEEAILANFILQLEDKQIRLPREDVGKLVMGMLNALGRQHPFKEDGPHRHWFKGFYKRNPHIIQSRSTTSPIPREPLKENQIQQFLDELKRLDYMKLIPYAAHNLHLAVLDETGYHFALNNEVPIAQPPIPYIPPSITTPTLVDPATSSGLKEDKPRRRNWSNEQLNWAIEQVNNNLISIKDASERTGIPIATIRNHCRNPQMSGRRGPPTVLTALEEQALERFLLKLDDCGYRANREELGKIVMELVNRDKREHPFKEDGPHRHWFQGFYRRHKLLSSRKRASSSSLCRQEAPPELMRRFFDELTELKMQQGELTESRPKKVKQTPLDLTMQDTATPILDALPPSGLETSIGQPAHADLLPLSQTMLQPTAYDPDVPSTATTASATATPSTAASVAAHRKGGRPKQPLFSVRPCRQKTRTQKIMEFIRDFATRNGENVDDILWTLLTLRVKGSGNNELSDELAKLYKHWTNYINSASIEAPPTAPFGGMMTLINPLPQNLQHNLPQSMPVGNAPGMEVDMNAPDSMYQMRLNMDNTIMVSGDQNEITTV